MATYSPTTWVNGSTALSAANLNNIENGIVAALRADGGVAASAAQSISLALSGADKDLYIFIATDGKTYKIQERNSDKALVIKNTTDSVTLLELGPTASTTKLGGLQAVLVGTGGAGTATNPKVTVGPSLPSSGMSKWDVHIKTPFS